MKPETLQFILRHPIFWIVLVLKIIAGAVFAGGYFTDGFLPFLQHFAQHGGNPYTQFFENTPAAFPYGTTMLWILAAFIKPFAGFDNQLLHSFILKLPLLLADLFILIGLLNFVHGQNKRVLYLYWCSPILFYISYIYGQLDAIPTAILFASLFCIFKQKYLLSFIILGLGIAAKTHLILALPFFLGYAFIKKVPIRVLFLYLGSFLASGFIAMSPYLFSEGFQVMVLETGEAMKFFNLALPYNLQNIAYLVLPGICLFAFLTFYSQRQISRDFFLLYLGIIFSFVVILAPPMAGWFYWSIPFMVYFYAKYKEAPTFCFTLMNLAYFAFFILKQESDFFTSFSIIAPQISDIVLNPSIIGIEYSQLVQNISFTVLITSMLATIVWAYRMGIASNSEYRFDDKPFLVGIGGDSGCGKSTVVESLLEHFHEGHALCVNGDGAHRWERGDKNWKDFTHLNPKSNHLHTDLEHAIQLKNRKEINRVEYDHKTGKFTKPLPMDTKKFVLFNGLHPFYLGRMRQVMDMKIFIEPEEELRKHWKISRDMKKRGYTRDQVLEQMDQREKDADKYIRPQKKFADVVINFHPGTKIKNLGSDTEKFELKLGLEFDNSVNVEPFLSALEEIASLELEHDMNEDLTKQKCVVSGNVNGESLTKLLHTLMPNYHEISEKMGDFRDNLEGILQLFLLYYIGETLKFRETQR